MPQNMTHRLLAVFFLLSGATSLTYQVVWMRRLSLFFGSDVYAAAIILSVFMGGLSLGSWYSSRVGDRIRRPLCAYGVCELGIAVSALLFPELLDGFKEAYQSIYRAHIETGPWIYHAFRIGVSAATLLVPTFLMGATLPLLVRYFSDTKSEFTKEVSFFYSVNTLGAIIGTVSTGFLFLPILGVKATTAGAVGVNALIGAASVILGLFGKNPRPEAAVSPEETTPRRYLVCVAMAISGMAALALEVVWMRILVQSFSATVYAFAIMVACFLFGIFWGSHRIYGRLEKGAEAVELLAVLELGLAASVAALALISYVIPPLFGGVLWGLTASTNAFGLASVLAQFIVAGLLIMAPTFLLGATFPVAVQAFTPSLRECAYGTGTIYAANTLGAVLGPVLGGFLLLPFLGTRISLLAIAALFLAAAFLLDREQAVFFKRRGSRVIWALASIAAMAALTAILPPQVVLNYGLKASSPKTLFHGVGIAHTVDIFKTNPGNTVMMIDGNIEADTTLVQRRHFILKAHLPLLLHPHPRDIAVVGLGMGITLNALTHYPTVEVIRVIELSPDMVTAQRYLKEINDSVLQNPKVRLRVDDARNFMAMSDEKFDMITADPIHPRITAVGYLYTREYYERIKESLRPGGLVTQWMPMYSISKESFRIAFRTFASVFPNASFWYVRGHGLFVATAGSFAVDFANVKKYFFHPKVREDFSSIGIESPEQFLGYLLMDSKQIAQYLAQTDDRRVNTDDNAYLEYHAPFEFLEPTAKIVDELIRFSGWDIDTLLLNAGPDTREKIRRHFSARLDEIPDELSKPIL
jgi:spermidine synthase